MNCKEGDLAVIVRITTTPGSLNRFVTVVRPAREGEVFRSIEGKCMRLYIPIDAGPGWVVRASTPLPWAVTRGPNKGQVRYYREMAIRDSSLRPIRDQPGEDEMLRIAGKPKDLAMPDRAVGRDRFADLIRRVTS